MRRFPYCLKATNSHKFEKLKIYNIIRDIRKSIYTFLLNRKSENEYFDFDSYFLTNKLTDENKNTILSTISSELAKLGWNIKIVYGNSGMFIYSGETIPTCCLDSEIFE